MSVATFDLFGEFEDAIAYAKSRGIVLPDEFYKRMTDQARTRAFTISRLATLDQIQSAKDSLDDALKNGTSFYDWKKQALNDAATGALTKSHLSTIFRNSIQQSYMAGHWQEFEDGKDARPYLMYDAINDSRTRQTHKALDGYIAPVDSEFWDSNMPPNGHNCRCGIRSFTEAQAKARGWTGKQKAVPKTSSGEDAAPDKGWAFNPGKGGRTIGLVDVLENRISGIDIGSLVTAAFFHELIAMLTKEIDNEDKQE